MIVLVHIGYWLTGISMFAAVFAVVGGLHLVERVRFPPWMIVAFEWSCMASGVLALITVLGFLPYVVGASIWGDFLK